MKAGRLLMLAAAFKLFDFHLWCMRFRSSLLRLVDSSLQSSPAFAGPSRSVIAEYESPAVSCFAAHPPCSRRLLRPEVRQLGALECSGILALLPSFLEP